MRLGTPQKKKPTPSCPIEQERPKKSAMKGLIKERESSQRKMHRSGWERRAWALRVRRRETDTGKQGVDSRGRGGEYTGSTEPKERENAEKKRREGIGARAS